MPRPIITVLVGAAVALLAALGPSAARGQEEAGLPRVYLVNADGTGLSPVPGPGGYHAAWSPDGGRIAYAFGSVVVVAGPDGSTPTELAAGPDIKVVPSWSPDGERIAFLAYQAAGGMTLSVAAVDGSGVTKLADAGQAYPEPPAWSPDGSRIAFAGPGPGGSDVWVINADGTNPRQLTDLPGEVLGPAWSPDGSRIAFGDATYDFDSPSALYVVNADGSGLTELTRWQVPQGEPENQGGPRPSPTADSTAIQGAPAWSPDGARLAFATIGGLAVVAVDGSGLAVLPEEEFQVMDPAWSPDGTRLAFGGLPRDAEFAPSGDTHDDLYVVNPDGTGLVRVAATPLVDLSPAWSPDGTRIAFTSEPPGN